MPKIKLYKTYTLNEEISEEVYLSALEERNLAGIVILKEEYYLGGSLKMRMRRELDEQGRISREFQYSSDGEEPDQFSEYTYNEQNEIHVVETSYRDNSKSFRQYNYDKSEKSLTILIKDEENVLEGKEYRKFDEKARVIHEEIYAEEESFVSHTETVYDDYDNYLERYFEYPDDFIREYFYKYVRNDKAQVTKIQIVDTNNKLVREDFMEYDEQGNRIIHRFSDFEQNLSEIRKFEFDQNSRVVKEEKFGADENLIESTTYVYREDGILIEEQHLSISGEIVLSFEYEFFEEVS